MSISFTERSNISIYPPILINNSVYWTKVRKNVHGKKRVLIIDDDEDINNLFKIYLENRGYQINAYTDPVNLYIISKKDFMIWFYLT